MRNYKTGAQCLRLLCRQVAPFHDGRTFFFRAFSADNNGALLDPDVAAVNEKVKIASDPVLGGYFSLTCKRKYDMSMAIVVICIIGADVQVIGARALTKIIKRGSL